jgi:murein L,D-transpeptidase YafK
LKRPTLRALLLAPATIAAAVTLAGCNADSIAPNGRAMAPLSDKTLALIADKNMDKESPILVRIFKEESEMEVWKKDRSGQFALLKTYPICKWSGALGPKKKEGDRQAPEGFYSITPGQMNPNSSYYLSFNTGYPNAYDRAWGRTGSELMVHGDCSSRGCYAMTDEQIQEIYALARESFFGGQKEFQLEAFPFHMTAMNMAKHRNNPNFAFWKMLKEGYDHFDATHQEPKVAVCEKRYVFDATAPANASRPLSFNPRGKCPVYQLDPAIADAVLDHRRQEQFKMAQYIADGVATVPMRQGDGGMNPVFVAKLGGEQFDNDGRVYAAATAPGSLPRTASAPAEAAPKATPVKLARVPVPPPAPEAKEGVAPKPAKSIASLIGNMFSSAPAETAAPAESEPAIGLRGTKSATAAKKTKRAATRHTPPKAEAVAHAVPKPEPRNVAQAEPEKSEAAPAPAAAAVPEMRSAFSGTPAPTTNGMLAGAQPVMPAGSFDARWAGLR